MAKALRLPSLSHTLLTGAIKAPTGLFIFRFNVKFGAFKVLSFHDKRYFTLNMFVHFGASSVNSA